MPVDTAKLRESSTHVARFLDYEREVESGIRMEEDERRREIDEAKRAREKKARRKRLKKIRATSGE